MLEMFRIVQEVSWTFPEICPWNSLKFKRMFPETSPGISTETLGNLPEMYREFRGYFPECSRRISPGPVPEISRNFWECFRNRLNFLQCFRKLSCKVLGKFPESSALCSGGSRRDNGTIEQPKTNKKHIEILCQKPTGLRRLNNIAVKK